MNLTEFHERHATAQRPSGVRGLTTAEDVQQRSGLPWLRLRLPFAVPHEAMLAEAENLRDCFVPHRGYKESHSGWFSLCIHGLSTVHTGPHTRYGYGDDAPYQWTDLCKFCPVTHHFFRDVFGYRLYYRVRFMLLTPGGFILPHRDAEVDRLTAINIALNNPSGCDFVMADCGIVPFEPGTANLLSLSRLHSVRNLSAEDRYHIIVHGERAALWDDIILTSYR